MGAHPTEKTFCVDAALIRDQTQTGQQIANECGCSREFVRQRREALGMPPYHVFVQQQRFAQLTGYLTVFKPVSRQQIADDLGWSTDVVNKVARKGGLDLAAALRLNKQRNRTKRCSICKATKLKVDFHKGGSTVDGLASACKECARKRAREWRPKEIVTPDDIWCPGCLQTKPNTDFWPSSHNTTGRQGYCKPCMAWLRKNAPATVYRLRRSYGIPPEVASKHAKYIKRD